MKWSILVLSLMMANVSLAGPHQKWKTAMSKLELTDYQKEQLKELRNNFKEDSSELRQSLKEARHDLFKFKNKNQNREEMREKFIRLQQLKARMNVKKFDLRMDSLSVLTPVQKMKMKKIIGKLWKHKYENHG